MYSHRGWHKLQSPRDEKMGEAKTRLVRNQNSKTTVVGYYVYYELVKELRQMLNQHKTVKTCLINASDPYLDTTWSPQNCTAARSLEMYLIRCS